MTITGAVPGLWLQISEPRSLLEGFTPGNVLLAAVVLALTFVAIRWAARLLDFVGARAPRSRLYVKWLEPILRISLWFVAILACVRLVAPTPQTFLAALGAMGLAIGLGAQDLVKNLIGGLVILADRPFQLGDRVSIAGHYGEIDQIGLNSTKLTTPEDNRVTIPNSAVVSGQVANANAGVLDCQVVTDLYLPANVDAEAAVRIGTEAAYCSPYLFAKKPVVVLASEGFDQRPYLRLRIKAYVYDHRFEPRMQSDITLRARRELARRGLAWRQPRTALQSASEAPQA
jgi:small-conductance mechanosensitive channel